MLKQIREFRKFVEITGFRNVKVTHIDNLLKMAEKLRQANIHIQFFDASLIATWQHLFFAVFNALTVFKNEESISRSLAMETMLYASSQRQIKKATQIIGVKTHTENVAVMILGDKPADVKSALSAISRQLNAQPDDTVLELSDEKVAKIRKVFDITDTELKTIAKEGDLENALVDLVIERVALLSTER